MYCQFCGKEYQVHCSCLKTNPVRNIEVYILFGVMLLVPLFIFQFVFPYEQIYDSNFVFHGSIILSMILIGLTILDYFFHRNYLAVFFGCHQRQNRSISFMQKIVPLCARCFGIYVGVLVSVLISYLISNLFVYSLILAIPLIVDGSLQKYKNIPSTNKRRFITGFLFGFPLVFIFSLYNITLIYLFEITIYS